MGRVRSTCVLMSPTRQKEREKKRILFLFVFGEFQTNLNGELGYFIFIILVNYLII